MTDPCGLDCFNTSAHLAMKDDVQRARWAQATGKPFEEAGEGESIDPALSFRFTASTLARA